MSDPKGLIKADNIFISPFSLFFFFKATMDRLAKLKITCSNARIRAKFDLLGENRLLVDHETWCFRQ
jgi:hypothetical protein